MSRLLNDARRMARNIISKFDHWDQQAVLSLGGVDYDIRCKYTNHYSKLNEFGVPTIGNKAIAEMHADELKEREVPYLSDGGLVNIKGGMLYISDAIATRVYEISSVQPDNTLGVIICNLELKNNNYTAL